MSQPIYPVRTATPAARPSLIFLPPPAGPQVFTQSFTATLSFIGAKATFIGYHLTATFSPVAALIKQTIKSAFAATLSFVGAIAFVKLFNKAFTATLRFNVINPSSISGLTLWLKADSLGLSDGTAVSTWTDSSGTGNNATQATGVNQPIFKTNIVNGKPTVRFDGSNDSLTFSSSPADTSVFVVASLGVAPASQTAYAPFTVFGTGTPLAGIDLTCRLTGTNWGVYVGSDLSSGEDLVNGTFNIIEATTSGAGTVIYRNGVQKATSGSRSNGDGSTAQIASQTGSSRWFNGDIAEILIYDSVLSQIDRTNVEKYLSAKYAIGGYQSPPLTLRTLKGLAGALSFVGVLVKRTGKALTAMLSFVGAIATSLIHGGTLFTQSLTATLSFGGALVKSASYHLGLAALSFVGAISKRTTKVLLATATFAGSLSKQIGKVFAATFNTTGAIAKRTAKALTAGLTFVGAVARGSAKSLTATLAPTGALIRSINYHLTATWSSVGLLTKRTAHSFTATLSFVGAMTTAAVHFFFKSLTATLSFTGALTTAGFHHFSQAFTATLTTAGALVRQVAKQMAGTLSFVGALAKRASKVFSATLSFVGVLTKLPLKSLTATLTFIGALAKFTRHSLAAVLSFIGNLATSFISGSHAHFVAFTATLAPTAVLIKRTVKTTFAATLSFIGVRTAVRIFFRAFTATLAFSGALRRAIGKTFAATLAFSSALARAIRKALTATLSFIASLAVTPPGKLIAGIITGASIKISIAGSKLLALIAGANIKISKAGSTLKKVDAAGSKLNIVETEADQTVERTE
jgi:hypothetical protein